MVRDAVLIAGPTASGKSALALGMAEKRDGIIVNADSMQVYSVLDILTARPGPDDRARAPHRLYGHVHPSSAYSTGRWLEDVRALCDDPATGGQPLIIVGGTGLYFKALLGGLSEMPNIPDAVRQRWRYRLAEDGPEALHRLLRQRDPDAAMSVRAADGQRIVRALEIMEVSGVSITTWQSRPAKPLVDSARARKLIIEPDRETLARIIAQRFDNMLEAGAVDEVRALLSLGLDPGMPAMKAIGVRQIADHLAGRTSLGEAAELAKTATRQYAKRQMTWFRNQCGPEWERECITAS